MMDANFYSYTPDKTLVAIFDGHGKNGKVYHCSDSPLLCHFLVFFILLYHLTKRMPPIKRLSSSHSTSKIIRQYL